MIITGLEFPCKSISGIINWKRITLKFQTWNFFFCMDFKFNTHRRHKYSALSQEPAIVDAIVGNAIYAT